MMQNLAFFLAFLVLTAPNATSAQTKAAAQGAKSSTATHSTAASRKPRNGIPVIHGIVKTAFSLKYEDYKIGNGPLAEPNKLYHVLYTGYLAATGQIFDSSEEHRAPVMKDGKPEIGPDGKPELGPPQPFVFPQGFGRLIPGFDQGFAGMHVGGKRRIFVPWQLGYGMRDIPARGTEHPGIPPKSDLIFDVELVYVTEMPVMPKRRMGMPTHPPMPPVHPAEPAKPGAPAGSAPAPSAPAADSATPQPRN